MWVGYVNEAKVLGMGIGGEQIERANWAWVLEMYGCTIRFLMLFYLDFTLIEVCSIADGCRRG